MKQSFVFALAIAFVTACSTAPPRQNHASSESLPETVLVTYRVRQGEEPIWMLSLFAWNNNTRNPTRPGVSRSTDYWTTKLETSAAHFGFSSGRSVLCWLLLAPTSRTFCSRAQRPARKKWLCARHWERANGESRDNCSRKVACSRCWARSWAWF